MRIIVAFDVKNYVEVMEGWPLEHDNVGFFLEREGNVLKKVCLSFSGVSIKYAPNFNTSSEEHGDAKLEIKDGGHAIKARVKAMNWQAVVSGIQVIDLDYDNFEFRYRAESPEEERKIHLTSFKSDYDHSLNCACDFEQIGRAFCVDPIPDSRVESTSHYREGRLAFEAGRYVDAYNNMFLFLETRYCDGKTKTTQQIHLLEKSSAVCSSIEQASNDLISFERFEKNEHFELFDHSESIQGKIKALVLLRGKLRHHSLKSPHRWDPNKQDKYKGEARFLASVVQNIVIQESLADIYSPASLEKFREQSVASGNETRVILTTHRLEREQSLELNISYPTTVVSSQLCLNAVRQGIEQCEKNGQLSDTVRLEALHGKRDLDLFSVELGLWAYTRDRDKCIDRGVEFIRCSFELLHADLISKQSFSIPRYQSRIKILDAWKLLIISFNHIENRDPTTRIMSLELFTHDDRVPLVSYRLGSLVRN